MTFLITLASSFALPDLMGAFADSVFSIPIFHNASPLHRRKPMASPLTRRPQRSSRQSRRRRHAGEAERRLDAEKASKDESLFSRATTVSVFVEAEGGIARKALGMGVILTPQFRS
ncbi:hypothetical protein [Rhizobium leguminosarum]|uniref:hypothetical protein n=1 Tax=Rhizobium leguminosarum TaxID=384 RepID=UPI001427AADB|nr:hypothetical protein [Rhizobium leguminosarum]MBY5738116.1 hypothetical protein [Rhizobium leguminosarum]